MDIILNLTPQLAKKKLEAHDCSKLVALIKVDDSTIPSERDTINAVRIVAVKGVTVCFRCRNMYPII